MGQAVEVVTAQGTAIGATLAALAASAGDSLAVRSFEIGKMAKILQAWADVQVAGTARIRSPKMHDNVQGMRFDTIIGEPRPQMPLGVSQRVFPNDTIGVDLAGSAVAGDIEYVAMLIYYEDLPGAAGRFIKADELARRGVNQSWVENTLALGTGGGYTGSEAINAEFDQFHADAEYALVGFEVDTECALVGYRGADLGNYRVAGPGDETIRWVTADWFRRLSVAFDMQLIPVFRANNKAGFNIDGVQDENGADTTVISYFVELAPGAVR